MAGVPKEIVERQLGHFERVHPDYAAGVREALARSGGGEDKARSIQAAE